jgi:hypothetical protein
MPHPQDAESVNPRLGRAWHVPCEGVIKIPMSPRVLLLPLALAVPACFIAAESEDPPPPAVVYESSGTGVFHWSIGGAKNPDDCDQTDAEALLVSIWTEAGAHIGDFEQYCQVFEASIELDPGTYQAEAVLLAPDGIERTTPVQIPSFDILGNDMLEVPLEFPASAFY